MKGKYHVKSPQVMNGKFSADDSFNLANRIKIIDNTVYVDGVNTQVNVQGAPGASIYDLAVKNGFEGSEKDWFNMLASQNVLERMYMLATQNGYSEGSLTDWLINRETLDDYVVHQEEGQTLKKKGEVEHFTPEDAEHDKVTLARTFAVNNIAGGEEEFYVPPVHEYSFLSGAKGKSAYEQAKEAGFQGTEEEWLNTAIARDLSKGMYEKAAAAGYVGTYEDWLRDKESLQDYVKSSYLDEEIVE